MAEITLALGAELDIASGDEVREIGGKVDRLHKLFEARPRVRSFGRKLHETLTGGGGFTYQFLVLRGGTTVSPPSGWLWDIRRISVWPTDPFTVLAGVTVLPLISAQEIQPTSVEPQFEHVLNPGLAVPGALTWSGREATVEQHESILLCVKGLANGVQVMAAAQVEQYLTDDRSGEYAS